MSNPNTEFVKVYDVATRITTTIPASELTAGMVRIQLNGSDEVLWADAAELDAAQGPHRHPPFSGARREKVLYIEQSLRDVYPKTYEAWEDGFRQDLHVEQELDLWVRVSRCLTEFTERHSPSPDERQEAFEVLGACLNATPTTVFETVSVRLLDRTVAQQLADAFFSNDRDFRMSQPFMLPKLSDYWDTAKDAIPRFAAELAAQSPTAAKETTTAIRAAVTEHLRVLPDQWLPRVAFVVAEDLYRAANTITAWNASVADYLACSAATFFGLLSQRGYRLHYVIDNSFQEMQRPIQLFPLWFRACGIEYQCPQLVESEFGLEPTESQGVVSQVLRGFFADGRHYVVLDTDSIESSFDTPLEQRDTKGVLTVIRTEAPGPGSKALVYLAGQPLT